jgi:hypothetical protein
LRGGFEKLCVIFSQRDVKNLNCYNRIMNKKYVVDIAFQIGIVLVAYSFFIDCGNLLAEEKGLLPSLSVCSENYFGFWGVIFISLAFNFFFREKCKKN